MGSTLHFVVPGRPQPWKRAGQQRRSRRGLPLARPRTYSRNEGAQQTIALLARVAMTEQDFDLVPAGVPVRLELVARFRARVLRDVGTRHAVRPDMDNVEKQVMDALTGIAWADDAQVARKVTDKVWAREAGLEVTVARFGT